MTWKTLAESLDSALASMVNEAGDGDGCNRPDAVKVAKSRKNAGTKAPASYREVKQREKPTEATQPGKAPASLGNAKRGCTHPHEQAPLGVHPRLPLRVIEGGRPAEGGGVSRAAYRASGEEGEPARNLKLVVG